MKIVLILLLILIPLMGTLYYFGIATPQMTFGLFNCAFSFPTRWEGELHGSSGLMRRNFVVFKKYRALTIQVETRSGTLEFEVTGPDGSVLSPVSGVYGRDSSALIDVSQLKRCSVTLRMDHFDGKFHIALQ